MPKISAISLTLAVNDWLTHPRHPRILHIFDRACNLINEQKEVLSIVVPEIGDGPFNLVVETDILFTEHLSLESPISNSADQLNLGELIINTTDATPWNPIPDWEMLHSRKDNIANQLLKLPSTNYLKRSGLDMPSAIASGCSTTTNLQSLVSNFSSALVSADISSAKTTASQLAGLGQGLTPSGDDFLVGALHAAWIIHPREVATVLAQTVADSAAPLTTSLSAAWLRSAARGEAGIRWHELFDSLVMGNEIRIKESVEKILAVGETSGADALAGFVGVFSAHALQGDSRGGL